MLILEFHFFFNMKRKYAHIFAKFSFEKLLQTLQTQIRQRTSFKGFETFLE